jgi:hypothetical protein
MTIERAVCGRALARRNAMEISHRLSLIPWIVTVAVVAAIGVGFLGRPVAFPQTNGAADSGPVVLELFTSQGCSSCPPADALLSELGSSTADVVPLAYHVDYWNHLGWSDPFSSPQWSERQSSYARAMNLDGDYTPQMVIGGGLQCVGSDRRSVSYAIAAARSVRATGRVSLTTIPSASGARELQVKVNVRMLREAGNRPPEVMVAIYESGLVTKIGGGENGGREITYDYTVRKLLPAFELDAAQGASVEKELSIDLDPTWELSHLGVAAFIQDPVSLTIEGAAVKYPIAKD